MNAEAIIRSIESEHIKSDIPEIYVGDTVEVGVRITEGNKERVQPYKGTVIAKQNGGISETITVRKIFQGVGVERVFLLHSPMIDKIKVERRGKVRRAKLYYLRDRIGKATRIKQRFDRPIKGAPSKGSAKKART
ncbi:50S ribosomal protein L19 [Pleurocapsales cyanobacterium LEGE 10410]|nr:50S ribosomal protein L19 [Pleurocapsales cyanobacterium LEGE 10410]